MVESVEPDSDGLLVVAEDLEKVLPAVLALGTEPEVGDWLDVESVRPGCDERL